MGKKAVLMSKRGFSERPKLTFNLTSDVYLGRIGNTQHIVVGFSPKFFPWLLFDIRQEVFIWFLAAN